MTRVLVCGGRTYVDREWMRTALDAAHEARGVTLLINGDAKGADRLATDWASDNGVPLALYRAHWRKLGKQAGPMRNAWMPDVVLAFPGGRGTAGMKRLAHEAGVEVVEVPARDAGAGK